MVFSRVLWTIALCFNKKETPSATIFETFGNEIETNLTKNMPWICILVATCIISRNVLVYRYFFQVFAEKIKFEANSHGLFNFSKKDSASKHALKTKFIFNRSLLFSKSKFSDKTSVLE